MFDVMRKHITATVQSNMSERFTTGSHELSEDVEPNDTAASWSPSHHGIQSNPSIEILEFFIDTSRVVREKTRSAQYTNHTYTVNKDSHKLVIELPFLKTTPCSY